jgi:hypothetical protein
VTDTKRRMISERMVWLVLVFWCLTPFSKIFQIYRGGKLAKWSFPNGVAELYLLLSSSQELSFKCWENLVITPAHC